MTHEPVAPVARYTCDICGGARDGSQRHRLVWNTGLGTELVLAELCSRCADRPGPLLEVYGGRGHAALRITHVQAARAARWHAMQNTILRGLVYVLIALAAFVLVTSITSR